MFSCIRLRKRQQCCKPKIGGETPVTNKLSSESNKGSNSVHENVWKKYYVILLPRTPVIFFWDGHGFLLKRSILITFPLFEAWGTWNEVEIDDTKTSKEGPTYVEGENRKRKNRKRKNINCRRKGNWRKRKGTKEKYYGKGSREQGVESKATHVQLHSFTKAKIML